MIYLIEMRNMGITENMTIDKDLLLEGGVFKDDVYIESTRFSLKSARIDGNVYFTNGEAQKSFKMDNNYSIMGNQELKNDILHN